MVALVGMAEEVGFGGWDLGEFLTAVTGARDNSQGTSVLMTGREAVFQLPDLLVLSRLARPDSVIWPFLRSLAAR